MGKNKALVINEYTHKKFFLQQNPYQHKQLEDSYVHLEEYGINDNVTVGFKLLHLNYRFKLNSTEVGSVFNDNYAKKIADFYMRYRLWQTPKFVCSVQPMINHQSFEIRGLIGYSYQNKKKQQEFYNIEVAHSSNKAFGDEGIVDITYGIELKEDWLLMNQFFLRKKIKKRQKSYWQYTYDTKEENTVQTMSSNNKSVMIQNLFQTNASLEQKISIVKKFNEKYNLALGFSSYLNDSNFLGNGISLALWVNL